MTVRRIARHFKVSLLGLILGVTMLYLGLNLVTSRITDKGSVETGLTIENGYYVAFTRHPVIGISNDELFIKNVYSEKEYKVNNVPIGNLQLVSSPTQTNGGFYLANIDFSVGGLLSRYLSGNVPTSAESINGYSSSFWFCQTGVEFQRIMRINASQGLVNDIFTHPTGNGDFVQVVVDYATSRSNYDFRIESAVNGSKLEPIKWLPMDISKVNEVYIDKDKMLYFEFDKVVPRNLQSIKEMPELSTGRLKLLDFNTEIVKSLACRLPADVKYYDANAHIIQINEKQIDLLLFLVKYSKDNSLEMDAYLLRTGAGDFTLNLLATVPIGGSVANHITVNPRPNNESKTYLICVVGHSGNGIYDHTRLGAKPLQIWALDIEELSGISLASFPQTELGVLQQQPIALDTGDFVVRSESGLAIISKDKKYRWIENSADISSMAAFTTTQNSIVR